MEHVGRLPESQPPVRGPFEKGRAAMEAYKWNEAIEHFKEAMKHAAGAELAALHGLVGKCQHTLGRWKEALASYEQSAWLAGKSRDKRCRAAALDNIGVIQRGRGEYDKALETLEAALKLAREAGARPQEASAVGNIGGTRLLKDEDEKETPQYFQDALRIHEETGDKEGQAATLVNLSIVCPRDQAMGYWEKGYKLAREAGAKRIEAGALANLGFLLKDKPGPDRTVEHHEQALKLIREVGDKTAETVFLANLGGSMVDRGEHEKALPVYVQGYKICTSLDLAELAGPQRFRWGLSKCLGALGRDRFVAACVKSGMPGPEAEKLARELASVRER